MPEKNTIEYRLLSAENGFKRRGLSLLISLLVHAVIFILIIILFSPVEVFVFQDVRDVIIAPEERLKLPEERNFPGEIAPADPTAARPAETGTAVPSRSLPSLPAVEGAESGPVSGVVSIYSSRFQLSPPVREPLRLPSGYELDPSLGRERLKRESSYEERYRPPSNVDVRRYMSATSPSGYIGVRQHPGGTVQSRIQSAQVREYDISPWANKVVEKVMGNWIISRTRHADAIGQVEIAFVIDRLGQVSNVRVIKSTQADVLEEAAFKAIELSVPLPELPWDYPGNNLEIRLVFSLQ